MKKKISEKDKKDWEDFITKKDKVEDKDNLLKQKTSYNDHMEIDLHGYSLDEANTKIFEFINEYGIKKFVTRSKYLSTAYGQYFDLPHSLNDASGIEKLLKNDQF